MEVPIVTRYEGNPILTKEDIPYKVETVHNAGVAKHNGKYYISEERFKRMRERFGSA